MNQPPLMANEIKCKHAKGYRGVMGPTFTVNIKFAYLCPSSLGSSLF